MTTSVSHDAEDRLQKRSRRSHGAAQRALAKECVGDGEQHDVDRCAAEHVVDGERSVSAIRSSCDGGHFRQTGDAAQQQQPDQSGAHTRFVRNPAEIAGDAGAGTPHQGCCHGEGRGEQRQGIVGEVEHAGVQAGRKTESSLR
jgi:hypothetical protein